LPEERAWIDRVVEADYVDTFRHFHPDLPEQYTWWSVPTNARARNVGWRIDYFFVTVETLDRVSDAFILPEVMGSDHCPVGVRYAAALPPVRRNSRDNSLSSHATNSGTAVKIEE
jgi:exodeoxyribonuclease-3